MFKSKDYYKLLKIVADDYRNSIEAFRREGYEIETYRDMLDAFGWVSGSDVWEDVYYQDQKYGFDMCSDIARELVDQHTGEVIYFGKFIKDLKRELGF